eukprot:symbB.v1.2.032825.t1/scaffold3996.1/size46731/2
MNPCDPATRQIAGIQETRNEDTDAVLNLAGRGPISRWVYVPRRRQSANLDGSARHRNIKLPIAQENSHACG